MTKPAIRTLLTAALFAASAFPLAQIPKSLGDQFSYDANGVLHLSKNGQSQAVLGNTDKYTLADLTGNPTGAETGIQLDFGKPKLNGTVAYGPHMENALYPTITYNPKPVKLR